ncbi:MULTISPECIES: hypothetical protein [unclassified Streptomyces]|uniref:hypothetical protein n=1 Tax=unclassified Streptomyces TaxID=2593676 RepID=UPI0037FCA6C7
MSFARLLHRGDDIGADPRHEAQGDAGGDPAAAELALGPDELRRLDAALPPSAAGTPRASCT